MSFSWRTDRLDWDGAPDKLVLAAYNLAKAHADPLLEQYQRDYNMYRAFVNQADLDPDRAFVFIPKMFNIIDMKSATDAAALFGNRPYIPFKTNNQQYKMIAEVQSEVLDHLLAKANFWLHGNMLTKMKTTYGIGYMEAVPYYENVVEKIPVPIEVGGQVVGFQPKEQLVQRFSLCLRTYAPWDVLPDPAATGLESADMCRFVIKIRFVSARSMQKMAQEGRKYTDLDFDKIRGSRDMSGADADHKGRMILRDFGLLSESLDDDIHVMLSYESPDRYIELLDGHIPCVDVPNPYRHKMINLSRMIHNIDPHTQNQMYSIGECKPNEILQSLLNDSWSDTVNVFNIQKQPVIMHRESIDPNTLVWTQGNRISIPETGRPIEQDIKVEQGTPLPPDHFQMLGTIERYMDLTAKAFAPQRGEVGAGSATATEIAMTKSVGDKTQEQIVRMAELVFLRDFGKKALSIIEQFMPPQDVVEIVGPEKAQFWFGGNPAAVPGGYSFDFKASDQVVNQTVRQRVVRDILPYLQQLLQGGQLTLAKLVLDVYDFKESEKADILQEAAAMMLMQMQMQAAQQQAEVEMENKKIESKEKKDEKGNDGRLVRGTTQSRS